MRKPDSTNDIMLAIDETFVMNILPAHLSKNPYGFLMLGSRDRGEILESGGNVVCKYLVLPDILQLYDVNPKAIKYGSFQDLKDALSTIVKTHLSPSNTVFTEGSIPDLESIVAMASISTPVEDIPISKVRSVKKKG